MPSEASRKQAEELCRKAGCECGGTGAIGRETVRAEHACGGDDGLCQTLCPVPVQDVSYDECERFHDFAAALDAARAEGVAEGEKRGAERERWECHKATASSTNQARIHAANLIAARGPMRGPEE